MSAPINRRVLVTTCIFLTLMVILVTSVLMFSKGYNNITATVHTVIGFVFLMVALWHLSHNFPSLKRYLSPTTLFSKTTKYGFAPQMGVVLSLSLLTLALIDAAPFKRFHAWGAALRLADGNSVEASEAISYRVLDLGRQELGRSIKLEFKKGPAFHWPQYAIWIETLDGTFVQPLYVTQSVATNTFKNSVRLNTGAPRFDSNPFSNKDFVFESLFSEKFTADASNNRFRQESLPVFLHKLKRDENIDRRINAAEMRAVDAYAGATQFDNFILQQKLKDISVGKYNLYLEINQSFDFNAYYTSDKFPDDPIYSGDGFSAQPSVVYVAQLDFNSPTKLYPMAALGHGHHSGANGVIDPNMENLTTALEIVDRVLVDIR
jgi:hypothetical protein